MKKITSLLTAAAMAAVISVTAYAGEAFVPVNEYISSGEYSSADNINGDTVLYLSDNEEPADAEEPVEEPEASFAESILKKLLISLCLGLVIALTVCFGMKSSMKTAKRQITANDYIRKNSFDITRSRDIFIYAQVTKRKRSKEKENK